MIYVIKGYDGKYLHTTRSPHHWADRKRALQFDEVTKEVAKKLAALWGSLAKVVRIRRVK